MTKATIVINNTNAKATIHTKKGISIPEQRLNVIESLVKKIGVIPTAGSTVVIGEYTYIYTTAGEWQEMGYEEWHDFINPVVPTADTSAEKNAKLFGVLKDILKGARQNGKSDYGFTISDSYLVNSLTSNKAVSIDAAKKWLMDNGYIRPIVISIPTRDRKYPNGKYFAFYGYRGKSDLPQATSKVVEYFASNFTKCKVISYQVCITDCVLENNKILVRKEVK